MLTHRSIFVQEQLQWFIALVRLRRDEEGFEEAIRAEPDISDEPSRVREPIHCQRHLLWRSLRRRRSAGLCLNDDVLVRHGRRRLRLLLHRVVTCASLSELASPTRLRPFLFIRSINTQFGFQVRTSNALN